LKHGIGSHIPLSNAPCTVEKKSSEHASPAKKNATVGGLCKLGAVIRVPGKAKE
jgi:hypothetical protein